MSADYKYLPADLADRLRQFGLTVGRPVEGSVQGLHRSPHFGSSVEFAEYRRYAPGDSVALIPTRYPGSEAAEDDQVRMARKTEWVEYGSGGYRGLGQRILSTDAGDYSLMDIRKIELDTADDSDNVAVNDVTAPGPEE